VFGRGRDMIQRIVRIIALLLLTITVTGCALFPEDSGWIDEFLETEDIPIEQLVNTDNFREGALEHILEGEINRQGEAVGFHYEGLSTAKGKVVEGTRTDPDTNGVYEAEVEIDGIKKSGNKGISTFFPLYWSTQEVIDGINEAYETKQFISGNTYEGLTEEGIVIRMYLDEEEKIISAFPIY